MLVKHLLIVELDPSFRLLLEEAVRGRAEVGSVADFPAARVRLVARPPDLVVTNLRLGAFNGLHLAYLVANGDWPSRAVVYCESLEVALAQEARRAGAFWEFQRRLPHALLAYLDADLPARDRRDPVRPDRRSALRGGRRASDIAGLTFDTSEVDQRLPSVRRVGQGLDGLLPALVMNVGEALRDAREQRGLSLDQLANATKIRVKTLQAIETNQRQNLPEAIFLRGFVRAYAREVGVNPEDTVRQYLAQFDPVSHRVESAQAATDKIRAELPPGVGGEAERDAAHRRVTRVQWLGLAMLVIGVAIYSTTAWWRASAPPLAVAIETPKSASHVGVPMAAAPLRADAATAGSSESTAAGTSRSDLLQLDIQAQGLCWLSAAVEGTRVVHRLLQPGEHQTIEVHDEAVLRVGDPAAFAFSINGVPGRSLGRAGEAVTVHITRENYRDFLRR